jgi:steroid 5-alpha reductase family enzyme
MKAVIGLLLVTAVVIPYVSYNFDEPLSPKQWGVLSILSKIALAKTALVFVTNWATNNYSQVDKLWSLMPVLYAWIIALNGGMNSRQLLMAGLITLWGIRLTFNFARKGGYTWPPWAGEEDYRWVHVRKISILAHPIAW